MTERVGYSQYWTPPGAASASSWRGLSLGHTVTQLVVAADSAAITWDVVFAETDGIRSTGTHGPYGPNSITVPVGAAGVVPAGMAGLWRLSGNDDVYPQSNPGTSGEYVAFGIIINGFDPFFEDDLMPDPTYPWDFNLTVASFVYPLEEGDVVWTNFTNASVNDCYTGGPDATFLMEYLGPVP